MQTLRSAVRSISACVVLAGCVSTPAPDHPIQYPKLVDGQPMIATEHGSQYTTSDCDDLGLDSKTEESCEGILGTEKKVRRWWTVSYGGRDLTGPEFAVMSPQYEEYRDKYEAASAKCSRGRLPKIAAYGFLIGAGGAWFLGERAGLDDTQRYIATGGALGAAALMAGLGYLLAGDSCTDAKIAAEILDDTRANYEFDNTEFMDEMGDLAKRFNEKHAPNAVPAVEGAVEPPASE